MPKQDKISAATFTLIKEFLLDQPCAHISPSERELAFRCPFCGDSVSNPNTTSFSINIDTESDRFLSYHCFRANCLAKGSVDGEFLSNLGFTKYDCIRDVNKYFSSRVITSDGTVKYKKAKELVNVINTDTELAGYKLKYINHRLGLDLSYEDLYNLKINLSVNDLMRINGLEIPVDKSYYYNNLSNYGVAFISAYNDYVIIRDISKSKKLKLRYTNLNVFNNYKDATKIYAIPSKLDLMCPEPTVLNVSEGAFDIIGVKYHLNIDRKYKNQIFAAACGAGIVSTVEHFIKQYGLLNCKINIFSDADVPIEKYSALSKMKKYLMKYDVTVYYNTKEKDFGVSKDKISFVKSKL